MSKITDWKRVTVYMLPEEYRILRMKMIDINMSITEYVRELILISMGIYVDENPVDFAKPEQQTQEPQPQPQQETTSEEEKLENS